MKIYCTKLGQNVIIPTRATPGSAGLDLYSCETVTIEAGQRCIVSTGIAMAIPEDCYGQVMSRSGLAAKNGIFVLNAPGIIDSDYRGELRVILYNSGPEKFIIDEGMRIAQMIITKYESCNFELVDSLDQTERGSGGFGSTGN